MKAAAALLLTSSLGVNAVLVYVAWHQFASASSARQVTQVPSPAAVPAPDPNIDPTAHIDPQTWAAFSSEGDLKGFVAQLRAKGYPPVLLQAIVRARIREQFADKFAPLIAASAAQPYWRPSFGPGADPKLAIARRALHREITEIVQQLLGPDANDNSVSAIATRRRAYGSLAPEKVTICAPIPTPDQSVARGRALR